MKKKIYGVVTLTAVLIGATLLLEKTAVVAAATSPTGMKNVVRVHGAFADGSGWEPVLAERSERILMHRCRTGRLPEIGTPARLDLVLHTLRVGFTVAKEKGE